MRPLLLLLYALLLSPAVEAQPASSAEIQLQLQKLNTVGSVLMIAAHPDDENTLLLAYFARHRHLRTGYLSLTRGEGGQNLIGPEQGDAMGLIRTQELLAARRIDGAEQFFTRAIDFGFSKTAEETLEKWGREAVLSDIVWVIRAYRPDVLVFRFSGTARDGHGQHQSSAILGKEAFLAAGDASRFPEQLKSVKAFQPRRAFFNLFSFSPQQEKENAAVPNKIEMDAGAFNPLLGASYGEIAGRSRSQHASQGMGSQEQRGSLRNQLVVVAGEPASKDMLEGIDTTWNRLPGGATVAPLLAEGLRSFDPQHPEKTLPLLLKARPLIAAMDHPEAVRKLRDLDETITLCAGLWLDVSTASPTAVPGSTARINLTIVRRLSTPVDFVGVEFSPCSPERPNWLPVAVPFPFNQPVLHRIDYAVPSNAPYSQPYWLAAPKQGTLYSVAGQTMIGAPEIRPTATFRLRIGEAEFTAVRTVQHRYVDSVHGELTRPFLLVPPVAVELSQPALLFPSAQSRTIQVSVRANQPKAAGTLRLEAPQGWRIEPPSREFQLQQMNEQTALSFTITSPSADSQGSLKAVATIGGASISSGQKTISYPHIPPQTTFTPATASLVRTDIRVLSKNVGYLMGAGDEVPDALRQIGVNVTLLSDEDLASGNLSAYDAIVAGVRVFNTRPAVRANFQRLLDYTKNGGVFIVQYNVLEGFPGRERNENTSRLGPYPLQLSRSRVTVEESPVLFPNPNHALLQSPNKITAKDFDGWVQERGLYFPGQFDSHYQTLFSTHDPNEDWLPGGTLYTTYGKGAYIYTSYAWFRQLPAGVPGAFRIFANLLSAGK